MVIEFLVKFKGSCYIEAENEEEAINKLKNKRNGLVEWVDSWRIGDYTEV